MEQKTYFFYVLSLVWICFSGQVQASGPYLWQFNDGTDHACCLYFSGEDVCNPNSYCTRSLQADLSGISDYITRVLSTENGEAAFYSTFLHQVQFYIRHAMTSFCGLSYRFSEQRIIQYFHNMTAQKQKDKTTKFAGAANNKNEDMVLKYLIKLGIARPLRV